MGLSFGSSIYLLYIYLTIKTKVMILGDYIITERDSNIGFAVIQKVNRLQLGEANIRISKAVSEEFTYAMCRVTKVEEIVEDFEYVFEVVGTTEDEEQEVRTVVLSRTAIY